MIFQKKVYSALPNLCNSAFSSALVLTWTCVGVIWWTSVLLGQGSLTTTGRGWQGLASLTASVMCSAEQLPSLWTPPSWAAARSNHNHQLIVLDTVSVFTLCVLDICVGAASVRVRLR